MMFIMGILIWAVIAIATTAAAIGLYIAICKINGRWGMSKVCSSKEIESVS